MDLGIIGCGGRGSWIADLFQKHGGYNIVALADYFPDRVEALGDKLGVPPARRFTGLSAYRRLLEQKLDAVAIESPPFFHPTQAADAVAAGKHVYLAKPVAVDVPGCMTIEQSAAKATANQPCFLVDFQTRANEPFIEAMRRVHDGATRARSSSARPPITPRIRSRRRPSTPGRTTPRAACGHGASPASCRATSSPSRTSTRSTS